MSSYESPNPEGRAFAATRWSVVLAAGRGGSEGSRQALSELCSTYWYPLYGYARRRGHDAEEARDLTQEFFAKLLSKDELAAADPERGRFRTFLLTAMRNFLTGEWRKEQALKRGGGRAVLPLDFGSAEETYDQEPFHELGPEEYFERRWALGVLEETVSQLREEYSNAGKQELFDALKGFLGAGEEAPPYATLAARLGQSEGALRTAASRLRSRWRKRLRELVAETVGDESQVEEELRNLISALETGM